MADHDLASQLALGSRNTIMVMPYGDIGSGHSPDSEEAFAHQHLPSKNEVYVGFKISSNKG